MPQPTFQYIAPEGVIVDGIPTEGMTVRAATGQRLGRFSGFVLDPAEQCVRYIVVRASRLSGKNTLLPFSVVRMDADHRAIEIDVDEQELRLFRGFSLDALMT
jgi:hypothetical protein